MFTYLKLILTIIFTFLTDFVQSENVQCFKAPNICPNENVTFWLYTKDCQQDGEQINIHNFTKLNEQFADKEKAIKILIHGYTSNRDDIFNVKMRTALFQSNDMYVISVNWTPLTYRGCREISSLNTRVVGNCTAHLIDQLTQYANTPLENIHVIGFSLGGQTAGFVSSNLHTTGRKLFRLSGLDPTLPYFNTSDLSQRLDSSDADWVDVYHTASGTRSQIVPSGHIDFYFNDGQDQPGCEEGDQNADNPHICSHLRSVFFYVESINSKTGFFGHKCEFNGNLPLAACAKETSILAGYHVPYGSNGVYQVNTASESPYALGPNA